MAALIISAVAVKEGREARRCRTSWLPDGLARAGDGADVAAAFERELTLAELAVWRTGEEGRRAAEVYLTRPATGRTCWACTASTSTTSTLSTGSPATRP